MSVKLIKINNEQQNTSIVILYWKLYLELSPKFLAFLSAFNANLEHVFVYQFP